MNVDAVLRAKFLSISCLAVVGFGGSGEGGAKQHYPSVAPGLPTFERFGECLVSEFSCLFFPTTTCFREREDDFPAAAVVHKANVVSVKRERCLSRLSWQQKAPHEWNRTRSRVTKLTLLRWGAERWLMFYRSNSSLLDNSNAQGHRGSQSFRCGAAKVVACMKLDALHVLSHPALVAQQCAGFSLRSPTPEISTSRPIRILLYVSP